MATQVGLILKFFDEVTVASRKNSPIQIARIITRAVLTIFSELDREAVIWAAVDSVPKTLDDNSRAQLKVANAHQGLRIDERSGAQAGGHRRSKDQAPRFREAPNSKVENANPVICMLLTFCLELDVGAWSFVLKNYVIIKDPSTKNQYAEKHQTSRSKMLIHLLACSDVLEFSVWSFPGSWILVLGAWCLECIESFSYWGLNSFQQPLYHLIHIDAFRLSTVIEKNAMS
jgi:hypothetical protein